MDRIVDNFFNVSVFSQSMPLILSGFGITVLVSLLVIIIGMAWGLLLTIVRTMEVRAINALIIFYVDFFRTMPQLVVLVLVYFGLPYIGIKLSPLVTTVLGLGAVLSAFASEIFWSSIKALPRGQWDAARALGFGSFRTLFTIILPQAVRMSIPLLTNRAIAVSKGTALGTAVALPEVLGQAQSLVGMLANPSPLTLAAACYLVFFIPLVVASRWLERAYCVGS
ncbi:amino acid ABC transporter permease [Cupriavidus basilensis]|uniref:ABC transporter permease protein n=1 Tax=Cupriavidus basilensis TaxID=68895 RepID=A0A0C4YD56_9BURK|nr:amino acid ABC transporter permease [Cupriavidus basilensis]AJG20705.1 ABC transporter permease protein [Cupriavidus basilensis]